MHLASVTGENPLGIGPGKYICEDRNAGELLANGWATKLRPLPATTAAGLIFLKEFDPACDWNGKKILFVRPGGFGDLLFLTPTIREMKRRWPDALVDVAAFKRYLPALENNPDIDDRREYPVALDEWGRFDAHVWLENLIEGGGDAERIHAVDLVAARCGLQITDKQMGYFVTLEETAVAERDFPRWPDRPKRIGIQVSASGRCRIYPHVLDVAQRLWRDGHEVFLFGSPGEVKTNSPEGIVNLMLLNKSFRESCAILATCDVLVGPDSALVHVAGALGKPCVALYGPFPWQLRTAYAPQTFALQGVGPCSPCFHHGRPGKGEFPAWGPCAKTGRCEVLAAIPAERVVREVTKKL